MSLFRLPPQGPVCGACLCRGRSTLATLLRPSRVHAGLKHASHRGKQLGRPKVDPAIEKRIHAQLRPGKVARECGVGTGTVQRELQ